LEFVFQRKNLMHRLPFAGKEESIACL